MFAIFKATLYVIGCVMLGIALGGGAGYLLYLKGPEFFPELLSRFRSDALVYSAVGTGVYAGGFFGFIFGTLRMVRLPPKQEKIQAGS